MSDNTILPERRYLEMRLPISEYCMAYVPEPVYRIIFRIDMENVSPLGIRLLGRKWTVREADGSLHIVEADHLFGQDPMLTPKAVFSYGGSRDFSAPPVSVELRFFGIDQMLTPFISTPCTFPKRFFHLRKKK